jgi:hypothetical protein
MQPTPEEEIHLFLDTNVLLHYDALDGVKWRTVVNAKRVILHVAQPVLEEIALKKDMGETKRLRKRAGTVTKRLLKCFDAENPFCLRQGEYLLLEPDSPRMDSFPDLNPASKDDQLIAAALTFRKSHSSNCFVVTGDSSLTLRVKLRRSSLEYLAAPDGFRLLEEADADERQREALQKELSELKQAQPDLKLTFITGGTVMHINQQDSDAESLIQSRMTKVRAELPHLEMPTYSPLAANLAHFSGTPEQIDAYNQALNKFYSRYEIWLREALAIKRRAVHIELSIYNAGSVPADSILVRLHFADGFKLIEAEDLSKEFPKSPKKPKKPGFDPQLLGRGWNDPKIFTPPSLALLSPQTRKSISIRKTNSYDVEWEHEKLRQNMSEPLDELVAVFESEVRSFAIDYEIRADNLRSVAKDTLHVVASEGDEVNATETMSGQPP